MILLTTTSDAIQVITGAAVVNTVVHSSWVDNASGIITPGRLNSVIATAATTSVVPSPAASTVRNLKFLTVRNTNAATSQTVTIQHTDGTNVVPLWFGVLPAGYTVQVDERGIVTIFTNGGIPLSTVGIGSLYNASVASVSAGYAADTYLVGSQIVIPSSRPRVGTKYRCKFDMTKTAAGTATAIATLRYGTLGTTGDAGICTFTFAAGTAVADVGEFEIVANFRTIGTGTTAVVQGTINLVSNLSTTGLTNASKVITVTSAGFDSTTGSYIGVSFNGGASFSGTNTQVEAELSAL